MKTVDEWSVEFDRLYDNIMSNRAPGLEPYEKSMFLTRAQESVVIAIYSGTLGEAFESTEAVTKYLSTLVKQDRIYQEEDIEYPEVPEGQADPNRENRVLTHNSHIFKLPTELLFRTYEACSLDCGGNCTDVMASVVPVTQDELFRTMRNPFKRHNKHRVLRLSYGDAVEANSTPHGEVETHYSELITDGKINYYLVRYIAKPEPIILNGVSSGLTINGKTGPKTCLLPEELHQIILSEAVRMAKAVWNS